VLNDRVPFAVDSAGQSLLGSLSSVMRPNGPTQLLS